MPSAAAQDVLQAILERRAAEKRRTLGATAAPMVLPFANSRIAGAFDAAEGMQEPSQALYAAKHQRAMDVLGNRPPEEPGFRDAIASLASLGPRAWGGAQKMWQAAPMAAEALYNDPLGSINSAGLAGQAATDAIVQGMAKPFMQFGDPNVDPVENAADIALTAMGGSAAIPAEENALRMGIKGRPAFRDFTKAAPEAEEGYVYHATRGSNAEDISGGSLDPHSPDYGTDQAEWPDRGTEDRSYWTRHPGTATLFVPEGSGPPTLLRTRETKSFRNEGTGDIYSRDPVPAKEIEFFGDDGQWHPLTEGDEQLSLFANKPRGGAVLVAAKGFEDLPNYSLDPQGRPLFSPYSRVKQDIPLSETSPIYGRGGAKQLPRTPFDLGRIKEGDVLFPFVSDRTYAGRDLAGIQIGDRRVMFNNPVPSEGGSGFMSRTVNPQHSVWASNPGVIAGQENRLRKIHAGLGKDNKIIGVTVGMASEGGDFSMQTVRTALEMLAQEPLTAEARATLHSALDDAMKAPWGKSFPAIPNWPGMDNLTDDMLRDMPGNWRSKLVKTLDTGGMKKQGAPNIAAVRKAAAAQDQVDDRSLTAGRGYFEFGGPATHLREADVTHPHSTYRSQIATEGGQSMGPGPIMPAEKLFPTWGEKAQGLKDMAQKQKSITTEYVAEPVTQELLRTMQDWLNSPEGKRLGIAGAIAAGVLTSGQALQIFGNQQSAPSAGAI